MKHFKNTVTTLLTGLFTLFTLFSAQAYAEAELYFIHSDHLGTPQVMTDKDQNVVWEAEQTPFGITETEGNIVQPMRFPGQYEDQETGFHYNINRDYDPTLGRYLQSDPIGLAGGLNTYGYTYQNPISYYDPEGTTAAAIAPGAVAAGAVLVTCTFSPKTCEDLARALANGASRLAESCGEAWNALSESGEDESESSNSNPYDGPVDEAVIVVNGNGTAIPVGQGESIGSSPDGRWQELKDKDGNRTGTRVDGGHPKTHDDPRAQGPHGHVDGVTNSDGTPWLPW